MEDDRWPIPKFDAGDPKHLHAVGTIAGTFVQFERGIESLFLYHPANAAVPLDLIQRYYFALSEGQRVATTRKFYREREEDGAVKSAVDNLLDFFDWAHDSRNKILHAERYPAGIGADPDLFYLTKRASKSDPSSRYMALDLKTLRSTAEFMRAGIVRCAELNIYVRYRSSSSEALALLPEDIQTFASSKDFPALDIPARIELSEYPVTWRLRSETKAAQG